jgi:7-keto-8-aminopelargonate synthetase-like enzyme
MCVDWALHNALSALLGAAMTAQRMDIFIWAVLSTALGLTGGALIGNSGWTEQQQQWLASVYGATRLPLSSGAVAQTAATIPIAWGLV